MPLGKYNHLVRSWKREKIPVSIYKREPTMRELQAMDTKNLLFNTALHLFEEYGFDTVTIDNITAEAGVSKGTFYTHFPTKEAVLGEQFRMIDEAYDEAFSKIDPDTVPAGEQLLLLIRTMTHYCSEECSVHAMKVVYSSQINNSRTIAILNNKERAIYHHLSRIVALGRETGEFAVHIPDDELVEYLMRLARSLLYDWCLYNGCFDLSEEGERYFGLILQLIRKK